MKAITLWQPWASLIAEGVKTIETRSWPAPAALVGERIAIHAAKRDTDRDLSIPEACWDALGRCIGGAAPPHGAVVATARLTACLPMVDYCGAHAGPACFPYELGPTWFYDPDPLPGGRRMVDITDQLPYGEFAPGRWAWLLTDVERLDEPIPAKGRQRLWEWTR